MMRQRLGALVAMLLSVSKAQFVCNFEGKDWDLSQWANCFKLRLRWDTTPFWTNLIDGANKGYNQGGDIKGLIHQSRQLYMFSIMHLSGVNARGGTSSLQAAKQGFEFLQEHMLDREQGGYYWSVSPDGWQVRDTRKSMGANSYAMYGLATFAQAAMASDPSTGREAAHAAKALCDVMMAKAVAGNDLGVHGFRTDFTKDWRETGQSKDFDTYLHLMEGFTALLKSVKQLPEEFTQAEVTEVSTALDFLVRVLNDRFFDDLENPCVDWQAWVPFTETNGCTRRRMGHGHMLEYAYLRVEALEALEEGDSASRSETLHAVLQKCLRDGLEMAKPGANPAETGGFDPTYGGISQYAIPPYGGGDEKIWWAQAESVSGLVWALKDQPDNEEYASTLSKQLEFIELHMVRDYDGGVWPDSTLRDGSPRNRDQVSFWKAAYHTGRALGNLVNEFGS